LNGELRVASLSKAFPVKVGWNDRRWQTVFEDIDFTVKKGEFVSVIGPSGCGKSTLLNIAAGLDKATAGAVYASDRLVSGPGLDRGVVFQEFALFPWLTVRDNVSFGLKSMGLRRAEALARANKFIELVGLAPFADYYPNRLSGGMRQRVGIGRALAIEPAVLLMDEPFGALDALTRENMQIALGAIWQDTRTSVLFITHDIDEAVYLSDRVLVLNGHPARIVLEAVIDLPRPRNRHDAAFQARTRKLEDAIRHPPPGRAPT
jgi:NitT/TauT family transport system ATP-binding protein